MPSAVSRRSGLRSESTKLSVDIKNRIICNCDWELRLGYAAAVGLALFEAKRFFLLALELYVEWQIIRFAGGYRPVLLTCFDITLGFPCALAAVCTIRNIRITESSRKSWKIIILLATILVCVILNVATMASIGYNMSVRQAAIARVFNASMYLYVTKESYKYSIDQIQFVLRCCGHASYADWFLFDWQLVDYASREEMRRQERISDEIYRERSVPFSCCKVRVLGPCLHSQMSEVDTRSINVDGCSGILSNFLVRIVFVAYAMTSILVLSQLVLAYFLARIAKTSMSKEFRKKSLTRMEFIEGTARPHARSMVSCPHRRDNAPCVWRTLTGSGMKNCVRERTKGSCGAVSGFSEISQDSTSPEVTYSEETRYRTARIKPSLHAEHRVPKKKPPGNKRLR